MDRPPQFTLRNLFQMMLWAAVAIVFCSAVRETYNPRLWSIAFISLATWVGGGVGAFWQRIGLGGAIGALVGAALAAAVINCAGCLSCTFFYNAN